MSRLKRNSRAAGFTLAEVLAAMLFMAIVIPVVVQATSIAGRAGVAAERKRVAAQLADRLLTEQVVTGEWRNGDKQGNLAPDYPGYRWRIVSEAWDQDAMRVVTVEVAYDVQGVESTVRLSTLVDEAEPTAAATQAPTAEAPPQ